MLPVVSRIQQNVFTSLLTSVLREKHVRACCLLLLLTAWHPTHRSCLRPPSGRSRSLLHFTIYGRGYLQERYFGEDLALRRTVASTEGRRTTERESSPGTPSRDVGAGSYWLAGMSPRDAVY